MYDLGCFPLDYRPSHLQSDYLFDWLCIQLYQYPYQLNYLPHNRYLKTLYLNIFRGEPAMSKFD